MEALERFCTKSAYLGYRKRYKKIRKKAEVMFEMKPEYYIGIDMIDQEHKQLFDYASEAYELLQEEFTPDKYDKIDAILENCVIIP